MWIFNNILVSIVVLLPTVTTDLTTASAAVAGGYLKINYLLRSFVLKSKRIDSGVTVQFEGL
jgi:hypothetical protein